VRHRRRPEAKASGGYEWDDAIDAEAAGGVA
jgi:hypothetical protein